MSVRLKSGSVNSEFGATVLYGITKVLTGNELAGLASDVIIEQPGRGWGRSFRLV
jgi:hypothetical protein